MPTTSESTTQSTQGTSGDDVLQGSTGNDTLSGGAGNDLLSGGAGNDLLKGGTGSDTLDGGTGNDTLDGGQGNDSLSGGAGSDTLDGGQGNDTLDGGQGNDALDGGQGNDSLSGGAGNDNLDGNQGNDTLDGGTGNDTLDGGQGNDQLTGSAGNDTLVGGAGNDTVLGGEGDDRVLGGSGNDVLDGGAGRDRVEGSSGNDLLVYNVSENLNTQGEEYLGGSGDDTLRLDLTLGQWMRDDFQTEISNYMSFMTSQANHQVEEDDDEGTQGAYAFSAFGLTAKGIEHLGIRVDGVALSAGDDPVLARDDLFTTGENSPISGNVTANDQVPDLIREVTLLNQPQAGALTFGADGSFTYDPGQAFDSLAQGETATVSFDYQVRDADGDTGTARASLVLTGANDAPVIGAGGATGAAAEDGQATASGQLTGMDVDHGAVLSWSVAGSANGAYGSLAVDQTGQWTYTLDNNSAAVQGLKAGEVQTETFTVQVTDEHGAAVSQDVTIAVTGTNDAPVAAGDLILVQPGVTTPLDVLANDKDVDGDALRIIEVQNDHAQVAPDGHGLLYTPAGAGFELVTYTVQDESGATSTATALVLTGGVAGGPGDDLIDQSAATQDLVIVGGPGDDSIVSGSGDDQVLWSAGQGNDTIDGGAGFDRMSLMLSDTQFDTVGVQAVDGHVVVTGPDFTLSLDGVEELALVGGPSGSSITIGDLTGTDIANDTVIFTGGPGNDSFNGAADAHTQDMIGNGGNDKLESGSGNDYLDGNSGNDTLTGNDGADSLNGGVGNDALYGGEGNDTLVGGAGADYVMAGSGDDTLVYDPDDKSLDGGTGTDVVKVDGYPLDLTVPSPNGQLLHNIEALDLRGHGVDSLRLDPDSVIALSDESNTLRVYGDQGDQIVATGNWTQGASTSDGFATYTSGDATLEVQVGVIVADPTDVRGVPADGNYGTPEIPYFPDPVAVLAEELEGGGITKDTGALGLVGITGADFPTSDFLGGIGISNDAMFDLGAGMAIDELDNLLSAADIFEHLGPAVEVLNAVITILEFVDAQPVFVKGTDQSDTLEYGLSIGKAMSLFGDPVGTALASFGQPVVIGGFGGNDVLEGYKVPEDSIAALAGDVGWGDLLDGGAGADTMRGYHGDDTYFVNDVGDKVEEVVGDKTYGGNDTVIVVNNITYVLPAEVENLFISPAAQGGNAVGNDLGNLMAGNDFANKLSGGDGNDRLTGRDGADTLDGGSGSDTMWGGLGNDTFVVDSLDDAVYENGLSGTDTIQASIDFDLRRPSVHGPVENLVLLGSLPLTGTGNDLNNYLEGNQGDNLLEGRAGDDTLRGGQDSVYGVDGFDTLDGGNGNDVYYVGYGDIIQDSDGDDKAYTSAGSGSPIVVNGITVGYTDTTFTYALPANFWIEELFLQEIVDKDPGDTISPNQDMGGTGGYGNNKITGNSGNNILTARAGNDTLIGGLGNDTLKGDDGHDSAAGAAGDARMEGGAGNDTYILMRLGDVIVEGANQGTDIAKSSAVDVTLPETQVENIALEGNLNLNATGNSLGNFITGNAGVNLLQGEGGDDRLIGGVGDTLEGGAGNDTLFSIGSASGLEGDVLKGGEDNDIYVLTHAGDTVEELANQGTDLVQSWVTYTLPANVENLRLMGPIDSLAMENVASTAPINGTGNDLPNLIIGNAANNVLDGAGGADTLRGGLGDDTYIVDNAGDVVSENATTVSQDYPDGSGHYPQMLQAGGYDTIQSSVSYTLPDNVEVLALTGIANIDGTGNATAANLIIGNVGNNTLDGGSDGWFYQDTLEGGAGNDMYVVEIAESQSNGIWKLQSDVVVEDFGKGTDTILLSGSSLFATYIIPDNVERLEVVGQYGVNVTGTTAADSIKGGVGSDILHGGNGDDTLDGGGDNNLLYGGFGDDTYYVRSERDVVIEDVVADVGGGFAGVYVSGGHDTVNAFVSYTLRDLDADHPRAVEDLILVDTVDGGSGTTAEGNALDNTLTGNSLDNLLLGREGNDTLLGGGGNDTLDGGDGQDSMVGGSGDDTYVLDQMSDVVVEVAGAAGGKDTIVTSIDFSLAALPNVENLTLTGSGHTGTGNDQANVLTGAAGDDRLDGGKGADTLIGGGGHDTFVVDNTGDVVDAGPFRQGVIESSVSYTLDQNDPGQLVLTGSSPINGTGSSYGGEIIHGNDAANVLKGGGGQFDQLWGGAGNDSYYFDDPDTYAIEHLESFVNGALVDVSGGGGIDTIYTPFSIDMTANFSTALRDASGNPLFGKVGGGIENVVLTGTDAVDAIGNELDNSLTGNDNDNLLDGGLGADTLIGGNGDDTYIVDNPRDVVTESGDSARLRFLEQVSAQFEANNYQPLNTAQIDVTAALAAAVGLEDTPASILAVLDAKSGVDQSISWSDVFSAGQQAPVGSPLWNFLGALQAEIPFGQSKLLGDIDVVQVLSRALGLLPETPEQILTGASGGDGILTGSELHLAISQLPHSGTDTVHLVNNAGMSGYTLDPFVENLIIETPGWSPALPLRGNAQDNLIVGNSGNELIHGLEGADTINGSGGNDTIDGGTGADSMTGGDGDDTYYVDNAGDTVVEISNVVWVPGTNQAPGQWVDLGGHDRVNSSVSFSLNAGVGTNNAEDLFLTGNANIDGTGNFSNNLISGNPGNNVLDGGAGYDTLQGNGGADTFIVDVYPSSPGFGDAVNEAKDAAIDVVLSYDSYWDLSHSSSSGHSSEVENLTFMTAGGNYNGVFGNIGIGNSLDNVITGNSADDNLSGLDGNDTLVGGDGDDTLDGGTGSDVLDGGAGSDVYFADATTDQIHDDANDASIDLVKASVDFTLPDHVENLTLTGTADLNGTGNALANTMVGNAGNNVLDGKGGADDISGGAGDDVIAYYGPEVHLSGDSGQDLLRVDGEGLTIDLTTDAGGRLQGFEGIDLGGHGNTLDLSRGVLQDFSDGSNTLRVYGDVGDKIVDLTGNWAEGSTFVDDAGRYFTVYTSAGAVLEVQSGVEFQANVIPPVAEISVGNLGDRGVELHASPDDPWYGIAVAAAGDLNGDGFGDLVVGVPQSRVSWTVEYSGNTYTYSAQSGRAYVVFGGPHSLGASDFDVPGAREAGVDLTANEGGRDGFSVTGESYSALGSSVAAAGDLNGDGHNDLIMGDLNAGGYVVYGKDVDPADSGTWFAADLAAASLTKLEGGGAHSGYAVASIGDFNGDGFADVVISAPYKTFSFYEGAAYVVFGSEGGLPPVTDLGSLDGRNGFELTEQNSHGARLGTTLSSAGDLNGDGFTDLIVGSQFGGDSVVFGGPNSPATLDASELDGTNGFTLFGGNGVAGGGDINGDGFNDLIVGAQGGQGAFVVLGSADMTPVANMVTTYNGYSSSPGNLWALDPALGGDGTYGFRVTPPAADSPYTVSVAIVGDINGDGFDDFAINTLTQPADSGYAVSVAYVVYGGQDFGASLDLATLDGRNGFRVTGDPNTLNLEVSVSGAGDLNGDGYDDLVVKNQTSWNQGHAYVIYGQDTGSAGTMGDAGDNVLTLRGDPEAVVHAGSGDDTIQISSTEFFRIDGGGGTDTLAIAGGGVALDFSSLPANAVQSIEIIDLGDGGNSVAITPRQAEAITGGNALQIDGTSGEVTLLAGGVKTVGAEYTTYQYGGVQIRVADGLSVAEVNAAPLIYDTHQQFTVPENEVGVGHIKARDDNGDTLTYSIAGGADASKFSVDADGGLRFIGAPDFEARGDAGGNNVYDVIVKATDGHGGSAQQALAVAVTDVDEAPYFAGDSQFSIPETAPQVFQILAYDPEHQNITYSLSGDDAGSFGITASGGLSFATSLNYQAPGDADHDNVYHVTVNATDPTGNMSSQDLTVQVTDVNRMPFFFGNDTEVSLSENQTGVLQMTAFDGDFDPLTFAIAGGPDAGLFAIDPATGELSFKQAPDFEHPAGGDNTYNVTLRVADPAGLSHTTDLVVNVTDVPDTFPPTSTAIEAAAGSDGAAFSKDVSGHFADANGDALSYSLAGAPAGLSIDAHGVITGTLGSAASQGGTDGAYGVTVTATDGTGSTSQTFALTVSNPPPSFAQGPYALSTPEGTQAGASLGSVAAADDDAVSYSITSGNDAGLFAIDSNGNLTLTQAIDDAQVGTYDLTVTALDGQGAASAASVAVALTGVNDAPTISSSVAVENGSFEAPSSGGASFTTLSAGSAGLPGWTVGGSDIDLIGSYWMAAGGAQSLDLNGGGPGSVQQVLQTTPGVEYTVNFDVSGWWGTGPYHLQVSAAGASGSTSASYTATPGNSSTDMNWQHQTFTFTATDTSTTLSFISLDQGAAGPALDNVRVSVDGYTANEHIPVVLGGLSVADVDAGGDSVLLHLSVGHGDLALTDVTGLTLVDGDGADGTLAVTGSLADINHALAGLTYTSDANYYGADSLAVTIDDQGHGGAGGALSATASLGITVHQTYAITSVESVENGSFEGPAVSGAFATVAPGTPDLTGWTVAGAGVDHIATYWQAADGVQSLDMNASGAGVVEQMFQTTSGAEYEVRFDLSGTPGSGPYHLEVAAAGENGSTSTSPMYTIAPGNSSTDMNWQHQTFTFTATDTSTTLSFTSLDGGPAGAALDKVEVVRVLSDFSLAENDVLDLSGLLDSVHVPDHSHAFSDGWLEFDTSSGDHTDVLFDADGGGDHFVPILTLVGTVLAESDAAHYHL